MITIANAVNTKGLSKSAVTPIGAGVRVQRDPFAPNYELVVYGGPGAQPYTISEQVTQFIEEITYEDNADQFDKLTIKMKSQIDNSGGGQINSIIDSRLFAEGHTIEIKLGYGNSLFTVGAADIVKVTPDFPADSPPTLEIIGYDLLHRASRRRPQGGVSYKGYRDSQIASIIGSRNGFDIQTTDPASFDGIKKTPGVFDRGVQNKGVSDYTYLKKIAEINGFDLFSKFNPERRKFSLFFQPPKTANQKEVYTFVYNQGEIPYHNTLLSFKPTLDAYDQSSDFEVFVLQNKETQRTKYNFIDRFTNEEQQKTIGELERRFTGGNVNSNGGKKVANSDGIQVAFKAFGRSFRFPPHKRFKNELQARKAIEEFIKRQKENFITGEGQLIGVETLQSRQIHNLEGISEQFSGKYYLTVVKHIMSRGDGYRVEFSGRKVIEDILVQAPPALNLTENDKRFAKIKKERKSREDI